jgi:hypothetical protein
MLPCRGLDRNGPLRDSRREFFFVCDIVFSQRFDEKGDVNRKVGLPLQRCQMDLAMKEPCQRFRGMEEMQTGIKGTCHERGEGGPFNNMVHRGLERHQDGPRMHPAHMDDANKGNGAREAERKTPSRGARVKALLDVLVPRGRKHKVDPFARYDLFDLLDRITRLKHAVGRDIHLLRPQGESLNRLLGSPECLVGNPFFRDGAEIDPRVRLHGKVQSVPRGNLGIQVLIDRGKDLSVHRSKIAPEDVKIKQDTHFETSENVIDPNNDDVVQGVGNSEAGLTLHASSIWEIYRTLLYLIR